MNQNNQSDQYLCFRLVGFHFAIPDQWVKAVGKSYEYTKIPYAPKEIKGTCLYENSTLTGIDLGLKLNLRQTPTNDPTYQTIIIPQNYEYYGLMVDDITDHVVLPMNRMIQPKNIAHNWQHLCSHIYPTAKDPIIILKLENLLSLTPIASQV